MREQSKERKYPLGRTVMAPVPVGVKTPVGWCPVRPKREMMKPCEVLHSHSTDGRYMLRVNRSHVDEDGNQHIIFAREDELRPYIDTRAPAREAVGTA